MKTSILILLLLIQGQVVSANEEVSCLDEYKASAAKKRERYKKAVDRYEKNRNAAMSATLSDGFMGSISAGGLMGSAYLQNSSRPMLSDYDLFEEEIIHATEADLSKFISFKPKLLETIYNASYEKHANVTFEKIQNLIRLGFAQGKFCGFLGKSREPGIKRFVLKELRNSDPNVVLSRDPAVVDSDGDNEAKEQELTRPIELPKGTHE
jgi:hypothetical protein